MTHPRVLFVLALATSLACRRAPLKPEPKAIPEKREAATAHEEVAIPERVELSAAAIAEAGITTWKVQPVDLAHLLLLNGSVEYDENRLLQIGSSAKGRVTSIPVDLGARVSKGTTLAVVESAELGKLREDLVRTLSEERVSSRAVERARMLSEAKAISTGELQSREGDHLTKKSAADAAARALTLVGDSTMRVTKIRRAVAAGQTPDIVDQLPRLSILAPFAGRVIDRKVTPGSLVEAGQTLLTLADLSKVWVFLQAFEKDLALLTDGLLVTVRTEAYAQETFSGRIDFLGSVVDASTRTVRVRATVDNRAEKLRPGMFVKGQVEVPKPVREAQAMAAVPQSALQTLEGRTQVFVQVQPGVFVRRSVETGHTFEGFTEVLSGVKTGEDVVTEGSFVLKSEFAKSTLAAED
ncbi:MAG: efflux RND transporter periplasmic adaptor subunit [Thermoanaerobaculia bacterium]